MAERSIDEMLRVATTRGRRLRTRRRLVAGGVLAVVAAIPLGVRLNYVDSRTVDVAASSAPVSSVVVSPESDESGGEEGFATIRVEDGSPLQVGSIGVSPIEGGVPLETIALKHALTITNTSDEPVDLRTSNDGLPGQTVCFFNDRCRPMVFLTVPTVESWTTIQPGASHTVLNVVRRPIDVAGGIFGLKMLLVVHTTDGSSTTHSATVTYRIDQQTWDRPYDPWAGRISLALDDGTAPFDVEGGEITRTRDLHLPDRPGPLIQRFVVTNRSDQPQYLAVVDPPSGGPEAIDVCLADACPTTANELSSEADSTPATYLVGVQDPDSDVALLPGAGRAFTVFVSRGASFSAGTHQVELELRYGTTAARDGRTALRITYDLDDVSWGVMAPVPPVPTVSVEGNATAGPGRAPVPSLAWADIAARTDQLAVLRAGRFTHTVTLSNVGTERIEIEITPSGPRDVTDLDGKLTARICALNPCDPVAALAPGESVDLPIEVQAGERFEPGRYPLTARFVVRTAPGGTVRDESVFDVVLVYDLPTASSS